jgi:hypothetical protein
MSTPSLVALPISGQLDEDLIRQIFHKMPAREPHTLRKILWMQLHDIKTTHNPAVTTRMEWGIGFPKIYHDQYILTMVTALSIPWFKSIVVRALQTALHTNGSVLIDGTTVRVGETGLQEDPTTIIRVYFRVPGQISWQTAIMMQLEFARVVIGLIERTSRTLNPWWQIVPPRLLGVTPWSGPCIEARPRPCPPYHVVRPTSHTACRIIDGMDRS